MQPGSTVMYVMDGPRRTWGRGSRRVRALSKGRPAQPIRRRTCRRLHYRSPASESAILTFFFYFFFYPFPFGERGLLSIADDRAEFPLWPASRNESAPSTGLGPTLMTQKTKELSVPDQR